MFSFRKRINIFKRCLSNNNNNQSKWNVEEESFSSIYHRIDNGWYEDGYEMKRPEVCNVSLLICIWSERDWFDFNWRDDGLQITRLYAFENNA